MGKTSSISPASPASRAFWRVHPGGVDDLRAVGHGRGVGGSKRQVEARVESDRNRLRSDPARPGHELGGEVKLDAGLFGELADPCGAMRQLVGIGVGLAACDSGDQLISLDPPAWEHPDAGHEACALRAPDEKYLELALRVLAAAAEEQDRRGGPSVSRHEAGLERIAGSGGVLGKLSFWAIRETSCPIERRTRGMRQRPRRNRPGVRAIPGTAGRSPFPG